MAGYKDFTDGNVLTAADLNDYLMQGVMVFDSSAARGSAIASPTEGMMSYLKDSNATEVYVGTTWTALRGQPEIVGFTSSGSYTVPAGCIELDVVVVGGGGPVGSPGGQVVTATVAVTPGEVVAVVVGPGGNTVAGTASSLTAVSATITANGGPNAPVGAANGVDGTYVPAWGWYGGGGAGYGGPGNYYAHGQGGGGDVFTPPQPNSGGGGSGGGGTNGIGAAGFVGIFAK